MATTTSRRLLVVVLGATASGKSNLALGLAERLGSEILSADSRQFYRETPIGTAMPSPEELARVPHHFIACRSITEPYSSGTFEAEALARLEELWKRHEVLFLVGGSGLYIDAVVGGFDPMPAIDPALREELNARLTSEGLEALQAQLQQLDPTHYEAMDRYNPQRVVRALEVCLQSGKPYSEWRHGGRKERPFEVLKLGIEMPREVLYERINQRVDIMVEQGLEAEARTLYPHQELNALRTVGYQEWFPHFEGQYSRDEAIALIKRNTRRYAKRQQTWFGRDEQIHWLAASEAPIQQGETLITEAIARLKREG